MKLSKKIALIFASSTDGSLCISIGIRKRITDKTIL